MSTSANNERTIVITGGLGNLGSKLCRHLLNNNSNNNNNADDETIIKNKVILLEHPKFIHADKPLPHPNAILIPCDLGSPFHTHTSSDGDSNNNNTLALEDALLNADTLIHFSAVNPYPNATWSESAQSMDHTFNIFTMAIKCKVRRIILASSNHVMGGYKDNNTSPYNAPSSIHPSTPPSLGTMPLDPNTLAISGDAKAYAAAKLAGERLAMALGSMYCSTAQPTSFVVLRIGWCQPGDNLPETLSAAGSPPEFLLNGADNNGSGVAEQSEDDKKDELWFKRMWLSNRDFLNYFEKAIELHVPTSEEEAEQLATAVASAATTTDAAGNTHEQFVHRNIRKGFVLVNAMSKNNCAKWNLDETEKLLGVVSIDDSLR